jgi:RNA 3'-terminal phosphate cyclase (GTP)
MIELDGSLYEGGGQMLRTAVSLSALTGKPFKIVNIRKGRKTPGLKNQHLHVLKAIQELTNAEIKGANLGSEEVEFTPKTLVQKNLNIEITTAGSITLVMQALSPLLMFMNSKVKIKGGTDVKWSPSYDYFVNVYGKFLNKYCKFNATISRRGYFPKGQGECEFIFRARINRTKHTAEEFLKQIRTSFEPLKLREKGELLHVKGVSHASQDQIEDQTTEKQARSPRLIFNADIRNEYSKSINKGSGITIWAIFENVIIGKDFVDDGFRTPEQIGRLVSENLDKEIKSGNSIDKHLADQVLIIMGLLPGSKIITEKTTNHMKSEIYVIEHFLQTTFMYDGYWLETRPSE